MGGTMVTQSVRLPDELAKRLEAIAKAAKRSKSSFIVEALKRYLDEREDLEIALARFRDPEAEWLDHEQVRRELDLD
jgi:predicted DNA-binding protein